MVSLDQDVKIVTQNEDARYDENGTAQRFIRVVFRVGTHGPYTTRFPQDGFTADQRNTKLNEIAAQYRF